VCGLPEDDSSRGSLLLDARLSIEQAPNRTWGITKDRLVKYAVLSPALGKTPPSKIAPRHVQSLVEKSPVHLPPAAKQVLSMATPLFPLVCGLK
jgi:hypothetical protein